MQTLAIRPASTFGPLIIEVDTDLTLLPEQSWLTLRSPACLPAAINGYHELHWPINGGTATVTMSIAQTAAMPEGRHHARFWLTLGADPHNPTERYEVPEPAGIKVSTQDNAHA